MSTSKHPTSLYSSKASVIDGLFVCPADENYLLARWCYQQNIYRGFYWNAAQALEKYMKAILLSNGQSAIHFSNDSKKPYRHNLERLLAAVRSIAFEFLPITLEQPIELEGKVWGWFDEPLTKYMKRINDAGDPNNRYNLYGINKLSGDLYKLDAIVYGLRRLTHNLYDTLYLNLTKNECEQHLTLAETFKKFPNYNPRRDFRFAQNAFEKCSNEVRFSFLNHNFPFSKSLQADFKHEPLQQRWYSENSPLYMRVFLYLDWTTSTETYEEVLELIPWIQQNIQLSKEDLGDLDNAYSLIKKRRERN